MSEIAMRSFQGHMMLRAKDLWVSRAPFVHADWMSNAVRLQRAHQGYGSIQEVRTGDRLTHTLTYHTSEEGLRGIFGSRMPKKLGSRDVVCNEDCTATGFEFFVLGADELALPKHPVTNVTQFHAQAMCLAIGADLMTDDQYVAVVKGPEGNRQHSTPNGKLFGPSGEEYVHSSLKERKTGTADVEDPSRPDGSYGTRDYTGNVWKWMKRNLQERNQFGVRGGSWGNDFPEFFAVSYRGYGLPDFRVGGVGFLAASPVQG